MGQKALLIAEKPDLMRQIEAVYNANRKKIPYEAKFVAQRGHLIELKSPNEIDEDLKSWSWDTLPIVPEKLGGWKYKIRSEKKSGKFMTSQERYDVIKKELNSGKYDFVINAGDPDQEGQLLIRETLEYAGSRLPVKRFWTNDLTEGAILDALINLRDDDEPALAHLLDAARGRQHSDYRFGMNISRAATLKMNVKAACGRCETPILAIVVKRENEIRNFKPKTVYGVKAEYAEGFSGTLFDASAMSKNQDETDEDKKSGIIWFDTKKEAEELIASLGDTGIVSSALRKRMSTYAPKLFKLASLQIAAGKMGYNDAETLSILQDLYEKKYVSYPRTDCEYLSSKEDFTGILRSAACVPDLASYVGSITPADISRVRGSKKWINDKALEDSGHSALRPTTAAPDFAKLSKEEADIYALICRQYVAIFLPPLVQDKAQVIVDIDGKTFRSTGSVLVSEGFSKIFGKSFTDSEIPDVKKGDTVSVGKYIIPEKTSTCPKRFTSPDLIAVCENPAKYLDDDSLKALGKRLRIGTPATRSAIIQKLIRSHQYIKEEADGKKVRLRPEKIGEEIIDNLGDCPICKVDMTGYWEEMLEDIRTGRLTLPEYEKKMQQDVDNIIRDIKARNMKDLGYLDTEGIKSRRPSKYKVVAKCPKCGSDVIESEKGFSCRGYKRDGSGCNVKMWKEKWHTNFSLEDFETLIGGGKVRKRITVSGITEEKLIVYDWDTFDVKVAGDTARPIGTCPSCGKADVMAGDMLFTCSGCGLRIYRNICGAKLTDEEFMDLLSGKDVVKTLCSKKGTWEQKLRYNKKEKTIDFARDVSEYRCPACGKAKMDVSEKAYSCPECGMTIWKSMSGHELTEDEIRELCEDGRTSGCVSGMFKKDGTPFRKDPVLAVDKKAKKIVFEW